MTLVACGLLALGVLAFMFSPMLAGPSRRFRVSPSAWSRQDELLKKKDFIYSAIRELNIDYNMGKLSPEDHKALRKEYMQEASDVLDALERNEATELSVEEQIEQAVADIRRDQGPVSSAPVKEVTGTVVENEAKSDNAAAYSAAACRNCGTFNEQSANFCIECGQSLKRRACGGCGTENPSSARFCAQCGEKLK